jgi:NAD(P)-dependent dehydrogenase (short-subunit alcohol dehydrogenase family)
MLRERGENRGGAVKSSNKTVLITGASAGIGLATASRLHRNDWTVIGSSRRGTSSGGWPGVVMDVDDDESVRDAIAAALAKHGQIDALVANAGWGLAGAVEQTPIEDAKAQLETNFFGAVRCVHAVLPGMRDVGSGRIVLVSSLGGVIGIPFQAFYSASKFALEGYGEALAYEVARFGIEVTLVQPGNIRTDFTSSRRDVAHSGDDAYAAQVRHAVRVMERDEARGAAPESVAAAIQRVLEAKRPPRRLSVGKLGERAGVFAKRLLPYRLFETAAKSSLGV